MGGTARCPICDVSVKTGNLRRHVDNMHPRHPDAAAVREKISDDDRYAPTAAPRPPIRIRKSWLAIVIGIVVIGVGVWAANSYASQPPPFSLNYCVPGGQDGYHIHYALSIFIGGNRFPIPFNIGNNPGCAQPVHTHEDYVPATQPARIHVEYMYARQFTVGDFFTVWGQPLTSTQLLDCTGTVTMTVNGVSVSHFGTHPVSDGENVVLSCG